MFLDALLLLSDAQAFTADAASTSSIDLGNTTPKRNIGDGEALALCIGVDVAADFTTANETYQFNVIQSAGADLGTPDVLVSRVILATALTIGSLHVIGIPPGAVTKRYIGASFTGGGTTPTITATIWLTPQSFIQRFVAYASGFTVL